MARSAPTVPTLVIQPRSRLVPLDVHELWQYREVAIRIAARDLTLRYRQTVLGVLWVIVQPLMAAGIFTVVFGVLAHFSSHGVPYVVFAFVGMTAWIAFSSAATRMSGSMMVNTTLITKVFFPRLLLPLASIGIVLVDLVVSLGLLGVLMLVYRIPPTPAILAGPFVLLILLVMAAGIGFMVAPLMARYRDIQYLMPVTLQMALFASPVAYAVDAAPSRARWFYEINPLTPLMEAIRWAFLGTQPPDLKWFAYGAGFAVVALVLGLLVFSEFESDAADVI